jgi:hypothetical protein
VRRKLLLCVAAYLFLPACATCNDGNAESLERPRPTLSGYRP